MKTKLFGIFVVAIGLFLFVGITHASTTEIIQPASIIYNENMTVNGHLAVTSLSVGSIDPGVGGVTYFNGSVINAAVSEDGDDIPFTIGDGVRIDGPIWRGESNSTSDGMPLKFADSLSPEISNLYDIGSTNHKWKNAYFAGEVVIGDLVGSSVVDSQNIQNGSVDGVDLTDAYRVGSAFDDRFVNTDGDQMTGQLKIDTEDVEGLYVSSSADYKSAIYGTASGTLARGGEFIVSGPGAIAVGGIANGDSVMYGGHFRANSPGGIAVYGHVNNDGHGPGTGGYFKTDTTYGKAVYGVAFHGSGNNVGGHFMSRSTSGVAVQGSVTQSSAYSGDFYGGNFKVDLGTEQKFEIVGLPAGTGIPVLISGDRLYYGSSSRRYKDNIADLKVVTADVMELRPVSFVNNQTNEEDIGLIAEEVGILVPDLVYKNDQGLPESVKYNRLPIYLLEVIKEQQGEIDDLRSIICNKYPQEQICN